MTYSISVTFKVTLTITKYKSDGTVDSERTESKSGSGSAMLTVKNGRFEVKTKPADFISQYFGDANGCRNKLGIGENATVLVFPEEGSGDTVEFYTATSTNFHMSGASFDAGVYAKQGTIDVYACINGAGEPDGPETIGVSVVEPTGMGLVKVGGGVWHKKNSASVGFFAMKYLTPGDVSFSAVSVYEDTCPAVTTGYFSGYFDPPNFPHPIGIPHNCDHNIDLVSDKRNVYSQDTITSGTHTKTPFSYGTFIWNIPHIFQCGANVKTIAIMPHEMTIDSNGNMTISKCGVTASAKFDDPDSYF